MLRRVASFGLVTTALIAFPAVASAQAKIVLKSGVEQNVDRIVKATTSQVIYKIAGANQTENASAVKEVYPQSGDISIGVRAMNDGKLDKAISAFEAATRRRADLKPFAYYFLGQAYQKAGQLQEAAAAFGQMIAADKDHFYAPQATFEGAECSRLLGNFSEASRLYKDLSRFGGFWGNRGQYGLAESLLGQNQGAKAEAEFRKIKNGASGEVRGLAEVGEARAKIQQGEVDRAKSTLASIATRRAEAASVKGMAFVGLAEAEAKGGQQRLALLAYLKSMILYGGESSYNTARAGAEKAAGAMNAGGLVPRIRQIPAGQNYEGKKPDAAYIESLMRVSAVLALEEVEKLLPRAAGEEKGDLAFLRADALRFTNKMEEYKKAIKEAQKLYPKNPRAREGALDLLLATYDQLKRTFSKAKDEENASAKAAMLKEVHDGYKDLVSTYKGLVVSARKQCEPIEQLDSFREKYTAENVAKMRRRDEIELRYCQILYDAGLTYPKGSSARNDYLSKAATELENFSLDRGEDFSFDLLAQCYKLKGLVLLDQGKDKQAMEEFDGLKEYVAPLRSSDPKVQADIKTFERSIKISGYRLFAQACARVKEYNRAIKAFEALDKAIPGYEKTREGLLAMFELTKCLAGVGRTTEARDKIYPLIENPNSVRIEGIDPSALQVEAAKALAGISDAAEGEIFPPPVQFQVGVGYKARGDDELAVIGYKGVLTAAVTEKEREKWVPLAVEEMGKLLYFQKRYLEACLAYRALFQEFPSHPKAKSAVSFARTCILEAMKQFGEDEAKGGPLLAIKKEIDQALVSITGGAAGARVIINEAGKLQVRQQYLRAAQKYLEVPQEYKDPKTGKVEPVRFYANAVANAGYCYFKEYEQTKNEKLLKDAESTLSKALALARKNDDQGSQAVAAYYLGELYNATKQPQKAIDALKDFDGSLGQLKKFATRARKEQVKAFLAANKPGEAERRYAAVKDESDTNVTIIALELAGWFAEKSASASQAKRPAAEVNELRQKAAKYVVAWYDRSKDVQREYLFWSGNLAVQGGESDAAARIYRDLFERFPRPEVKPNQIGAQAEAQERLHGSYDYARLNMARGLSEAGKAELAEEIYEELQNLVVLERERTKLMHLRGQLVSEKRETLADARGRKQRHKVYTLKINGQDQEFMVPSRQPDTIVVEGKDATRVYDRSQYLRVQRPFKTNYLVLEGMADATWRRYQKERDKNYLATKVQAAWNSLYIFLDKGLDEGEYDQMVKDLGLPKVKYTEKVMEVAYRLMEISFEREDWKRVVGEYQTFERLRYFDGLSKGLKGKFDSLYEQAKSKN